MKLAFPFSSVEGLIADYDKDDLLALSIQCASVKGDYLEVGSYRGLSALCIASAMPPGKALHCYDFFEPEKLEDVINNVQASGFSESIVLHAGNFMDYFNDSMPNPIAFAFIDHDHKLNTTAAAFNAIWPRLSNGGVIAFHDYCHPDYPEPTDFIRAIRGRRIIERGGLIAIQKP